MATCGAAPFLTTASPPRVTRVCAAQRRRKASRSAALSSTLGYSSPFLTSCARRAHAVGSQVREGTGCARGARGARTRGLVELAAAWD